jgi:secondary thiamine-phosphate synthase enzyme
MEIVEIRTSAHSCAVDITHHVASKLKQISASDGICLIYTPHTTAGLTINEGADPDVMDDVLKTLESLVPWRGVYKHTEGNSAAHVKAVLTGGSVQVIVDSGKPVLGAWERIFLLEFDGPRTRKIFIQFLAEEQRQR